MTLGLRNRRLPRCGFRVEVPRRERLRRNEGVQILHVGVPDPCVTDPHVVVVGGLFPRASEEVGAESRSDRLRFGAFGVLFVLVGHDDHPEDDAVFVNFCVMGHCFTLLFRYAYIVCDFRPPILQNEIEVDDAPDLGVCEGLGRMGLGGVEIGEPVGDALDELPVGEDRSAVCLGEIEDSRGYQGIVEVRVHPAVFNRVCRKGQVGLDPDYDLGIHYRQNWINRPVCVAVPSLVLVKGVVHLAVVYAAVPVLVCSVRVEIPRE